MKLKIVEAGWSGYSGSLGMVEFADGVSVRDVSLVESNSICTLIRVVDAKTDEPVGPLQIDASMNDVPAVSHTLKTWAEIQAEQGEPAAEPVVEIKTGYSKEELEAIADKDGIVGLRVIADPLGVKATSISKLIEAILVFGKPAEPEAAPLAEGQPDVVSSEEA